MDRHAFHKLLKRYAEGTCSKAEKEWIDQWYEWLDDESMLPPDHVLDKEMEDRLWRNIRGRVRVGGTRTPALRRRIPTWGKWAAAAAAVLILGVGFYIHGVKKTQEGGLSVSMERKEGLLEKINKTGVRQTYTLNDGSLVTLDPDAEFDYPRKFADDKREVYLKGTAFFSVGKDPARPFYVYNDKVVTQVLGTSFLEKTENGKVEVSVVTGRVAVYEKGDLPIGDAEGRQTSRNRLTSGVIITPNERVTYYTENHHFITSLVDTPVALSPGAGGPIQVKFVFEDAPLSEVLDNLQKAYNIQISVENDNLNRCPFTGDISGQSLYDKLEMICQSIGSTYEIKGTAILIKGKGCE
jgi:transmembrane sensor